MKSTLHKIGGVIYVLLCLMISGITAYLLYIAPDKGVSDVFVGLIVLVVIGCWVFYLWNWVLR